MATPIKFDCQELAAVIESPERLDDIAQWIAGMERENDIPTTARPSRRLNKPGKEKWVIILYKRIREIRTRKLSARRRETRPA